MLAKCESVHGGHLLVVEDPSSREALDISFYPGAPGETHLFHSNGRAVAEGVTYLGLLGPHTAQGVLQRIPEPLDPAPGDFSYIYAGSLHEWHYGHFLLSGLPRLWNMRAVIDDTTRLVYCGDRSPEELFRIPFLADIFSALGLGSHHLMRFPAGARFKRITVTAPSFEENNLGHLAYARLCNRIGDILTLNLPSKPSRRPLYLSKHKVQRGVSRVVNEGEVVDELVRLGADVVCPEELSIAEQVQLWRDRAVVYGFIGSAFHTGIFSRRPRCVVLNSGPMVWSNQLILDCINGASVDYYYSTAGIINAGRNGSFGNNFTLSNPVDLARALLERAQAACEET